MTTPLHQILAAKRPVEASDLPGITRPTDIPQLTAELMSSYDEREEVLTALERFEKAFDGLARNWLDIVCKLWKVSILVYRETPLWLLSGHHGLSCREGQHSGNVQEPETIIASLWPRNFTQGLASLMLHPFFSSRENGAFLRLSLQFAAARRNDDNRVWDISRLLSEAGIHCPALAALRDEMVRDGGTHPLGGAGGRIATSTAASAHERLATILQRFQGRAVSVEARFLLQIGLEVQGHWPGSQNRNLRSHNDPRDMFHLTNLDLDVAYQAADSVTSNPPSKRDVTGAWNLCCRQDDHRIQQVNKGNLKTLVKDAYRHELHLLQAFKDGIAGIYNAQPRTPSLAAGIPFQHITPPSPNSLEAGNAVAGNPSHQQFTPPQPMPPQQPLQNMFSHTPGYNPIPHPGPYQHGPEPGYVWPGHVAVASGRGGYGAQFGAPPIQQHNVIIMLPNMPGYNPTVSFGYGQYPPWPGQVVADSASHGVQSVAPPVQHQRPMPLSQGNSDFANEIRAPVPTPVEVRPESSLHTSEQQRHHANDLFDEKR